MKIATAATRTWLVSLAFSSLAVAAAPSRLTLLGRSKFLATPGEGVRVNAVSFYTDKNGYALKSYHSLQSRSDTADIAYQRLSIDNGRSWSEPTAIATHQKTAQGVRRSYPRSGYVDPATGVLVEFWLEGILPGDEPLEGMKHWSIRYRLSRDGGRRVYDDGPVIHAGGSYSANHPFPGVQIGKNSIMIGDQACATITLHNGELLQPVQITPLGPGGEYHNPGGGYTYHDAAVLIGTWNDRGRIAWTVSERVVGDPARSTRGMLEPTVAEFPDRRILMVLRGSNDRKPHLPAHKWYCVSEDHGRSWSEPRPWTYTDGVAFFSPSACSQLLKHSNGRIYWIGNISDTNPHGNLPRYPLVIAEVDLRSMFLIRDTRCVIDTRRNGDSATLQLSNFFAREDRETHDIVVHCSPLNRSPALGPDGKRLPVNWTADAWLYRVGVKEDEE